jgi:DNA primase
MILDIRKAYSYFKRRFVIKKTTQNWHGMECPFQCRGSEGKPNKFAVKFEWERTKCWLCGYSATIPEFVMDYEAVDYPEARDILTSEQDIGVDAEVLYSYQAIIKSSVSLPHGFKSLMDGDTIIGVRARNYVKSRGFDPEKLDMKGWGYCNEHYVNDDDPEAYKKDYYGYLIIPFKADGVLTYYIGRYFMGETKMKYKNPAADQFGVGKSEILYNEDALHLHDEIWIVEGAIDAETMGDFVVASMGWNLSTIQKSKILKSKAKSLVFVPDKKNETKDFYLEAVKTAMYFMDHKDVYVIDVDRMAGDGKDINELGKAAFIEERKKTKKMTYSKIMEILER